MSPLGSWLVMGGVVIVGILITLLIIALDERLQR